MAIRQRQEEIKQDMLYQAEREKVLRRQTREEKKMNLLKNQQNELQKLTKKLS